MVINTKNLQREYKYDLDWELEELDLDYCLGEWFYTSYQWVKYKRMREKLLKEIKINLSDGSV